MVRKQLLKCLVKDILAIPTEVMDKLLFERSIHGNALELYPKIVYIEPSEVYTIKGFNDLFEPFKEHVVETDTLRRWIDLDNIKFNRGCERYRKFHLCPPSFFMEG